MTDGTDINSARAGAPTIEVNDACHMSIFIACIKIKDIKARMTLQWRIFSLNFKQYIRLYNIASNKQSTLFRQKMDDEAVSGRPRVLGKEGTGPGKIVNIQIFNKIRLNFRSRKHNQMSTFQQI